MSKGQANLIIALGMVIITASALLNLFNVVQDAGMASDIRNNIINLITESERARALYTQERTYALDKALLMAGLSTETDCGYILVNESFPFLPEPNLNGLRIFYWKKNGKVCVPGWEDIGEDVQTYLEEMFGFADFEKFNLQNARLVSETEVEMNKVDNHWEGTFSPPYLKGSYTIAYYPDGTVRIYDDQGRLVVTTQKQNHAVLEDLYFFLKGPRTMEVYLTQKDESGRHICQEINGEEYYFKSFYDEDTHQWKVNVSTVSELQITTGNCPPGYEEVGKVNASYQPAPSCRGTVGEIYVPTGNTYNETIVVPGEVPNQEITITEYLVCQKDCQHYGLCREGICEYCNPSGNWVELRNGDLVDFNGKVYKVFLVDNLTGYFVSFEEEDPMTFIIQKEMLYYIPDRVQWEKVDKSIGEVSLEKGVIVYDFVPSEGDKLCLDFTSRRYNITNCISLLSRVTYSGGFADIYSYGKSFVEDNFMEEEIKRNLDLLLDVVEMKTLKIIQDGNVIPKQDWKMSLIWHLGLVGTSWEGRWDEIDSTYCHDLVLDGQSTEVCECDYNGNDCTPIAEESILAEFLRIFEQKAPERLKALTGYPWSIAVRSMDIKVKNLCNDEEMRVTYTADNDFYPTGYNLTIGIPMQFLFGEENYSSISADSSLCLISLSTGEVEDPCMDTGDCRSTLTCTAQGYCCPDDYEDVVDEYKCCKLVRSSVCLPDTNSIIREYECETEGGTVTITKEKSCVSYWGGMI